MLTGNEIIRRTSGENPDIVINPFDAVRVNPNSYNLTLDNELLVYSLQKLPSNLQKVFPDSEILDARRSNLTSKLLIPSSGLVLEPGILYLGKTKEYTETNNLIPCLSGRSSIARLGISVHVTAGFGDIGFKGFWTLEITVVHPVRIYPNTKICQIYYDVPVGDIGDNTYNGKYQNNTGIDASKMYLDK